jgi:hypothetical protein
MLYMSNDAPKIKYLNTDLDLIAPFNLTPLASALESRGVFPLSVTPGDNGLWYSTSEVDAMGPILASPEVTIRSMLDAMAKRGSTGLSAASVNSTLDTTAAKNPGPTTTG